MPALVVGSTTIPGVVSAVRTVVEAVERERAYDNTMLATKLAPNKASWRVEVVGITAAELNDVEAALVATPPIAITGDLITGVNAYPEIHGSEPMLGITPKAYRYTFTLHES